MFPEQDFKLPPGPHKLYKDTVVYVQDTLHDNVVVKTTHKRSDGCCQVREGTAGGKRGAAFVGNFPSVDESVRRVHVANTSEEAKRGVASAEAVWRDFCSDVVLYAAFRPVLWRQPIPTQLDVSPNHQIH